MSWSWDATNISHDETCWTYDGKDGCQPVAGKGGGKVDYTNVRAKKEDREMLDILTMVFMGRQR